MNRHTVHREGDVYRPVGATFGIFARSVDRIDDPDPRFSEAGGIVLLLFGEQPVIWPCGADCIAQEAVGIAIACLAQRLASEPLLLAHPCQQSPRFQSEFCGQRSIVKGGEIHFSGRIRSMM